MSLTLFKSMLKKNWTIILGLTAFILMELVVCIFMFEDIAGMNILGIGGSEILSFTASVLAIIGTMFPTVFFVFMVFRLVYKPIDSTNLSSHLSAGIKRTTYITTAAIFIFTSLFIIFLIVFVVCGLSMLYWGNIDWAAWLYVVFSVLTANIAVSSISFFFAAMFAPGSIAKGGMIGIPAILFVFTMISSYIKVFRWASVFMWIEITAETVSQRNFNLWWLWNLIYLAIAAVCYLASYFTFKKRQLAI